MSISIFTRYLLRWYTVKYIFISNADAVINKEDLVNIIKSNDLI